MEGGSRRQRAEDAAASLGQQRLSALVGARGFHTAWAFDDPLAIRRRGGAAPVGPNRDDGAPWDLRHPVVGFFEQLPHGAGRRLDRSNVACTLREARLELDEVRTMRRSAPRTAPAHPSARSPSAKRPALSASATESFCASLRHCADETRGVVERKLRRASRGRPRSRMRVMTPPARVRSSSRPGRRCHQGRLSRYSAPDGRELDRRAPHYGSFRLSVISAASPAWVPEDARCLGRATRSAIENRQNPRSGGRDRDRSPRPSA